MGNLDDVKTKAMADVNKAYAAEEAAWSKLSTGLRITIGVVFVLIAIGIFAWCAGSSSAHRKDRAANVQQALAPNTVAIAHADTSHQRATAGVVAATVAVQRADAHVATTRAAHAAARSRVTIANDSTVSIDSSPPVAVPAPLINVVRTSDSTIAAQDTAIVKHEAREDSLVADTVTMAHQRDLERQRADTLEQALVNTSAPLCGSTCKKVALVAVVGTTAVVAYNVARQIVRHLVVGPAKTERVSLVLLRIPVPIAR